MKQAGPRNLIIFLALVLFILATLTSGAVADRVFGFKPLDKIFPRKEINTTASVDQKILHEESIVVDAAERVSASVITVSMETPQRRILNYDIFKGLQSRIEGGTPRDIGTGFVISADGLIVTNKHVVSTTDAKYKVIMKDNKEYDVLEIHRDPSNDIAILKIDAKGLTPIELGDSTNLKVGQFAIAIGTALGEFRDTVTTGVISGLGRGITAGNPYEGFVEKLDDVIQTDAAINPGNSGGPLLNSLGQVIGVNVAVAEGAQNIGFAIPINIVKKGLEEFSSTGKFQAKAFLGVQYEMLTRQVAVMNKLPQGAYVTDVLPNSPADKAGIKSDDVITKLDGVDVNTQANGISDIISKKKVGDNLAVTIWRNDKELTLQATLSEATGE